MLAAIIILSWISSKSIIPIKFQKFIKLLPKSSSFKFCSMNKHYAIVKYLTLNRFNIDLQFNDELCHGFGWMERKKLYEECMAIKRNPITNNSYVIFVATSCITLPRCMNLYVCLRARQRGSDSLRVRENSLYLLMDHLFELNFPPVLLLLLFY